jgi:hypothetical protein
MAELILGTILIIVFISSALAAPFLAAWTVLAMVDYHLTNRAIRKARQELIDAGVLEPEPPTPIRTKPKWTFKLSNPNSSRT